MNTLRKFSSSEFWLPISLARKLEILHRRDMIVIAVVSVVAVVFETFGIGMLLPIMQFVENDGQIDNLIAQSSIWRGIHEVYQFVGLEISLLSLSATVFILISLRQVAQAARSIIVEITKAKAAKRLSELCFNSIMSCKGGHLQRVGSGNFSLLVSTQAQSAALIIRNISELWSNVITIAGYGTIMLSIALVPTAVAVGFGVITIASISGLVRMTRQTSDILVASKVAFSQFLVERLNAWRLVKASNSLAFETGLARRYTRRLAAIDVRLAKISNAINFIVVVSQVFLVLLILNISVSLLNMEIATVTLLFIAILRMMPIIGRFGRLRQSNALVSAYLSQISQYIEASEGHREIDVGTRKFNHLTESIDFDHVTFSYAEGDRAAVYDVSLSLPAGQIIAITGPSGAGKSTLVDMLPRLVTPESGCIRFDGVPIEEFSLSELRTGVHYVGQTPLLLNDSVLNNVRYAQQSASRDEVIEACKKAHAHEFIQDLPQGYDTEVGENGARLAGGQRQRLALARAFLSSAVIVVLDEPTSSLDYKSEGKILEALRALVSERQATVIVIAHRASTVLGSDYVIALEDGKITHRGPTKDAVDTQGWFREMIQTPEDITSKTEDTWT